MVKAAVVLLAAGILALAPDAREQDWPFYGGDQAGTKFSPLSDINETNVTRLVVAGNGSRKNVSPGAKASQVARRRWPKLGDGVSRAEP